MTNTDLIARLRERAEEERKIQRNNQAVAEALSAQMESFKRRDGTHNSFAVRLGYEHKRCAENDARLAMDWDAAADALTAAQERIEALEEAARVAETEWCAEESEGQIIADAIRALIVPAQAAMQEGRE